MPTAKYKYNEAQTKIVLCDNIETLYTYHITLPDPPKEEDIINYALPPREQFFKRLEQPKALAELCKMDDVKEAKRRLIANIELSEWVDNVFTIWETGQWQYINGTPQYFTGDYLMYLSFNKIDKGLPQYRSWDREKFQWWKFCVEDNPYCFGGIEMTRRRVGKSYIAGHLCLMSIIKGLGRNSGIQSKDDQSAANLFRTAIRNPLKYYPFWLKPSSSTDINVKGNRIEFDMPDEVTKASSLDAWVEYGTSDSKFFDGRKLYFYVNDESGKNTNSDVYETLSIVKPCLLEDEIIIGKSLFTSTVEEMERKGGANFKRIWDDSDRNPNVPEGQLRVDGNGRTVSGLYQWFTPAYANYIHDQYGEAIIDVPKDYQVEHRTAYLKAQGMNTDDAYKGGRQLIDEMIESQKGVKKQEMIRKFPRGIREAFRSSNTRCHFDEDIINTRLDYFRYGDNPFIAYYNLKWKNDDENSGIVEAHAATAQTGRFAFACLPPEEYRNRTVTKYGELHPEFEHLGCAGSDAFKHDNPKDMGRASMGTGYVYWGFDPKIDGGEDDMSKWLSADFICEYVNRPPTVEEYCEDMLKMCVFCSVQMYPEFNVDHVSRHFMKRGYAGYLKHGSKIKKKKGITVIEENTQAGAHTTEAAKPAFFKFMEKYVVTTAFRCKFPKLLHDIHDVEYHNLTPYDSFMGAVYAIMGYHEGLELKPVKEEKIDISIILKTY